MLLMNYKTFDVNVYNFILLGWEKNNEGCL